MLAYQIIGIPNLPPLTNTEIHEKLDQLETHLYTILNGGAPTPLEDEIADALADLGMIQHVAAEHLHRKILPNLDLQSEDILLAILQHPDLTPEALTRLARHTNTLEGARQILTHPACDIETLAALAHQPGRNQNHHHLRWGIPKLLAAHSPHGAAAALLATLPTHTMVLTDPEYIPLVEALGDAGYETIEAFTTLWNDQEGALLDIDGEELIRQAKLLT